MKYNMFLKALLVGVMLLGLSASAYAANTLGVTEHATATAAANVAPGDSVVIGAFKVTEGGTAAEDLKTFRLNGSAGANTIAAVDVTSLGVYWDVNQNGLLEPTIDVLQKGSTAANITTWKAGNLDLTLGTAIAFATSGTRYYLVVASVAKTSATPAAFDGDALSTTFTVLDSENLAVATATNANPDLVDVDATHLRWNAAAIEDRIAVAGGTTVLVAGVVAATTEILEAIDDYGNRDTGVNGNTAEVALSTVLYSDATTADAAVTSATGDAGNSGTIGDNKGYFTNGLIKYDNGGANAADISTLTLAGAANNVILVATVETLNLRGTIAIERAGAATTLQGIQAARGIEYYDVDHNGRIDRATFFFRSPIKYATLGAVPNVVCNSGGTAAVPISAFTVVGYTVVSGSVPKVNQDNGGYGINNGGPFAVTIELNESGADDTNSRPQGTYNAAVAAMYFQDAGPTAVQAIGPGDASEFDKARPILKDAKTVDANNDGFVDGISMTFSEPVVTTATSANPSKVAADPGAFTFALRTTDQDNLAVAEVFASSGGQVSVTNVGNTITLPVSTAGISAKNTGLWPVVLYSQSDGTYKLTDSNNIEFLADETTNATADVVIAIDDEVAAQVATITTNDVNNNGKIDFVAVEFTEAMDSSPFYFTGVTFDSGVATFGTNGVYSATATAISNITNKVINFTIGESGAGIYDTEAKPTLLFDQTGKLGDVHFTKAAKYGSGQVVPAIPASALVDGAAPKVVSATTGDTLTGASNEPTAVGADGKIDTYTLVFSEGLAIGTKTSGWSNARAAIQGFSVAAGGITLDAAGTIGGAGANADTQDMVYSDDTAPAVTNPELSNVTTGDQSATLTVHFDQVTAGNGWTALMVNGGDTGVEPEVTYTAGASNFITDLANNTLQIIATGTIVEVDGAAPRISTAAATAPETGDFFANVPAPAEDNADGDGYIDNVKIYFTEEVKVADATAVTGVKVFTSYNADADFADDRENAITLNIGVDANADTDVTFPDVSAAPVITAADNNFKFTSAVFYGTSAKRTTTGDTGMLPRIWYDGTSIVDTTGVAMAAIAVPTSNVAGGVVTVDKAKPVIMRALGIEGKNEINIQMSETVDLTGTDFGQSVPAQESRNVFGYENVDNAGNASLGAGYVVYRGAPDKSLLKLYTTSNLTASDVANDKIWIKTTVQDEAATPVVSVNDADGIVQASPLASIKIHIDDFVAPYVSKIESYDIDADGWVDHFLVTFSENIKKETFPGYVVDQPVAETIIDIDGYTGETFLFHTTAAKAAEDGYDDPGRYISANATPTWTADGSTVWIKVDERSAGANADTNTGDTGVTKAIVYAQTMPLLDTEETPFNIPSSAQTTADKAAPVIMAASQTSATAIEVTMSEDVNAATLNAKGFDWDIADVTVDGYDELQKFATAAESAVGKITLTLPATKALPAGKAQTIGYYTQVTSGAAGAIVAVKDAAGNSAIDCAGSEGGTPITVTLLSTTPDATVAKAVLNPVAAGLPAISNRNVTRVYFSGAALANDAVQVKLVDAAGTEVMVDATANAQGNFSGSIDASPLANGMVTVKAGRKVNDVVATWSVFADYLKETITVAAPTALAVTDVPNDQGGFVNVTFTKSGTDTGTASDFYAVDYYVLQGQKGADWYTLGTFATDGNVDTTYRAAGVWVGTEAITSYRLNAHVKLVGAAKPAADAPDAMSSAYVTAEGSAIDNIAPGAFTSVAADGTAGNGVVVSWVAPANHGLFNAQYNIWGVDKYEVYRKTDGDFALVGTVAPGTAQFVDAVNNGATVYEYLVKAVDGEQIVEGSVIKAMASSGSDFNGDNTVGLGDLVLFGNLWGKKSTDAAFVVNYDLNKDGEIGLGDLVLLGSSWGSSSKVAKAASPVANVAFNMNAEYNADNTTYFVTIDTQDVANVNGVALTLKYDAEKYDFVSESVTGLNDVKFIKAENGLVEVASFYKDSFAGTITLGFKAKGQVAEMNLEMVNAVVTINNVESIASKSGALTLKAMPTVYSLGQNFPNPFNPTTTIEYSIPRAGNVNLVVYNIAGQKVRTLVNGTQAANFYKVVWDGKNDNGESVATGMYFYKLVSGNYSKIVKMTLMK